MNNPLPLLQRERLQLLYLSLLLCSTLLIGSLAPASPAWLSRFAALVSDSYHAWQPRPASTQVVFIDIENTSVQAHGRWPWPRHLLAEALLRLDQAEAIALDMLFAEATTEADDLALAEAMQQLPLVNGVFLNGPQARHLTAEGYAQLLDSSLFQIQHAQLIQAQELELPTPLLSGASPVLATLNILPDADQHLRHYPLAFWVDDLAVPNLGVQLLRLAEQQPLLIDGRQAQFLGQTLQLDTLGRIKLSYYPLASYQRIPLADVLAADWDPARLAGKLVLVGVSEAGVTDLRATPVGYLPGPLVHVTLISNLLEGHIIQPIATLHWWLGLALLALLLIWIYYWPSALWRLAGYLLLMISLYVGAALLYRMSNLWLEAFYPLLLVLVAMLVGELILFTRHKRQGEQLQSAFSSYVAPALVKRIVQQGSALQLGGKRQELTLLFSDLRNFTPTTEALETEALVELLNQYFGCMITQLHRFQGTLDKLMGDGIMALFNAPLDDPEHAYHACLSAAAMQQALEAFNARFAEDDVRRLAMGIGLNTGPCVVGNIGAAGRFNYTAIGDAVNTAARLESATKGLTDLNGRPVDILLGPSTYALVKTRLGQYCAPVGAVQLKGKAQAVEAWALHWRDLAADLWP
ncbi:adenylate/guanylate cyclase domain-containing protein [Marinospirillum sp. MEB164]|uniref:Adenylate/guanylate cyclase domain-containing protein n=1 Tax=Marinospirillum alkalitolerans TaxID=3123374 RepID=A0ABW8PUQ2_9GAMM